MVYKSWQKEKQMKIGWHIQRYYTLLHAINLNLPVKSMSRNVNLNRNGIP